MTPQQITRELHVMGFDDEDINRICTHLAERLYTARLRTKHRVFTLDDAQTWLVEIAAVSFAGLLEAPAPIANCDVMGSSPLTLPDQMAVTEVGGGILVSGDSGRPPQPQATCHHCPHAVHGVELCGESLSPEVACGCRGSA